MSASHLAGRAPRGGLLAALIACCLALLAAGPAQAKYGISSFDVKITNEDGTAATQAGSHPFALTTSFEVDSIETGLFQWTLSGAARNLFLEQITGLAGNTTAVPRCSDVDFATTKGNGNWTACPDNTVIGINAVAVLGPIAFYQVPIYNLTPDPGAAAKIGFTVQAVPVTIDVAVTEKDPYNVVAIGRHTPQSVRFFSAATQLWGDPSDPAHDHFRGSCGVNEFFFFSFPPPPHPVTEVVYKPGASSCPVKRLEKPFLTLPRACQGPLVSHIATDAWQEPDVFVEESVLTHDAATPPNPQGLTGCARLGYSPAVKSETTSDSAETGTGLDFNLSLDAEGLENPQGLAQSDTKKAVVTLPEGVTINPSVGEGLGVCTPSDYARETLHSSPGEGCPNSSKIGTVHTESPLVDEPIDGEVFLAQQDDPNTTAPGAENPFDSLIALYVVLRNTNLGVVVKLPAKVEPDPTTGQLVTTLDNAPQFPISEFDFHFREGQRAPLITPAACGTYTTVTKLYPWADPANPRTVSSDFQITRGVNGGSCPPGGVPPFEPKFEAGSLNNNAASYSPFDMRLIREDGEQDMTKFSATLPPGVLGKLAGVAKCPDSAIADAKGKTGRQELANPSCPANSLIGHTLAGAGVGGALTYVKGYVYLGGPYHGDPLSVIAVTPALAGPFDAGTVVVQEALTLNPKTAEVEVDGANSDPIPHILKGIVLKLRDLRVNVDRPEFTLNPTSCDESSARAVLFGSYLDAINPFDDKPVDLSTRYQAANCLNLGFKPDLKLKLKGGTRRGGHPGLKAIYTPKRGDANIRDLLVRLPRSAFLDQAHIKTICTRVQFAAGGGNGERCPKAARYGYVKAWTPLLDEPLQGPVFLRSSNHKLPDMVLALHGLVDVEVAIRIDSAHGGIRATMENAPDATLSRVILRMQGAKKGLIINSRNLCAHRSRANVIGTGHNGKRSHTHPLMQARCGKARHKKHKRHHKRARVARSSSVS